MKKTGIILLLLLLSMPTFSQKVSKVGTTAAGFLSIDVGARAVAMGSAFVTISDDAAGMYWNPAGLARIQSAQAMFSHTAWLVDVAFNYAAVVVPLPGIGVIGASATFLSMDDMERTTINNPMGTGEYFSAGSYCFALSYSRSLTDRFSIGGNVKYVREQIYHSNATGVAFDIGTLFETQFNGLMIGMAISNYGTKMQMSGRDMLTQSDIDPSLHGNNENINAFLQTGEYDIPLTFRVGIGMDVLKGAGNSNLILAVDALHPNDDVESLNIGGEYTFNGMFSLRGGYKSLFARDSEEGMTLGGGIRYRVMGFTELRLDYAYQDFGIMNNVQKFTLNLGF
ncbi:PorV/PorQ family protein [candidate division KSB1 bacterium]|nr:PorV/PorQ family protein [candidate division KSB1 bacterium]